MILDAPSSQEPPTHHSKSSNEELSESSKNHSADSVLPLSLSPTNSNAGTPLFGRRHDALFYRLFHHQQHPAHPNLHPFPPSSSASHNVSSEGAASHNLSTPAIDPEEIAHTAPHTAASQNHTTSFLFFHRHEKKTNGGGKSDESLPSTGDCGEIASSPSVQHSPSSSSQSLESLPDEQVSAHGRGERLRASESTLAADVASHPNVSKIRPSSTHGSPKHKKATSLHRVSKTPDDVASSSEQKSPTPFSMFKNLLPPTKSKSLLMDPLHLPDNYLSTKYGQAEKIIGKGGSLLGVLINNPYFCIIPAGGIVRLFHKNGEPLHAVKEFRKRYKNESERDYLKKLTSEFCISSNLHHMSVVQTLDLIQDEKHRWCAIMEYVNILAHSLTLSHFISSALAVIYMK